jgi:hypothetical protein
MDLIIGSTGERDGDGVGGGHSSGMGAVYVLLGPITASVDVQTEAIRVSAAETNLSGDVVGRNLASSGDMDGDGLDELAVSALVGDDNVGSGSGTVHLKYGHDWTTDLVLEDFDAQFTGDSSYGMAGEAIRFGDVNGDGYDDMAVTSPKHGSERGMVYVIHGRASPFQDDWSLWTANVRLRGHRSGDGVGQSLEMIRPLDPADPRPLDRERGVNGSDYADLWIGGAGQNPSETGYLIYGPLPDMTDVIGPHAAAQFQLSDVAHSAAPLRSAWDGHVTVRSAGDFNGDGYVDLLAGFPWHHTPDADPSDDTQDGLVSLFLGGGD